MFVEYLRVQGFKSLADVELGDLAEINVFHGLNDVGKSNILESIDLLCRLLPELVFSGEEGWTVNERALSPYSFDTVFRRQNLPRREIEWTARARIARDEPALAFALRLQDSTLTLEWLQEPPDDETQRRLAEGSRFALLSADRHFQPEALAETPAIADSTRDRTAPENLKRRLFRAFAGDDLNQRERFFQLRDLLETRFGVGRLDAAMAARPTTPRSPDDPLRYALEVIARFLRPEGAFPVETLGSGVQQILLLLGQMLFNPARSVGIEEPEMNLSPDWQARLMAVFRDLVQAGPGGLDQIFITSHSPIFEFQDSFYLVTYKNQATCVARFPLARREELFGPQKLGEQRGQRLNSQNQVTLYQEVIQDLGLKYGDMVYFNKNAAGRWELYTEEEAMSDLREYWDDAGEHSA